MRSDKLPGQGSNRESVWDYPRPPRLEDSPKHIKVVFNGVVIAETRRAKRILETSHPPVYYIPPEDAKLEYFTPTPTTTFCEWKGAASYYTITVGDKTVKDAAWFYARPRASYAAIKAYIAFYPGKMDACYVDGERVQPQPGDFYGGWITHDIVGPFKGGSGTSGW
jgi:uncharacterized protein (DUF427 family)